MRMLMLLRGLPASGKSTFIKENHLEDYTVSSYTLRLLFGSNELTIDGEYSVNQSISNMMWKKLYEVLEKRFEIGAFTVLDATNIKTSDMQKASRLAKEYKYRVYCVDFTGVPIEECINRDLRRNENRRVGETVIRRMAESLKGNKVPGGIKVIKPNEWLEETRYRLQDISEYKKIHHIGDIHGCNTALQNYLQGDLKSDEFYIFLGDYIDRGIENVGVINFIYKILEYPNVVLLEGNHECMHKETEVLTDSGWVQITDVVDEKVAQFDIETKEITYEKPLEKIKKYSETLISIESHDMHQIVTPKHDVIYNSKKIKAEDLVKEPLEQKYFDFHGKVKNLGVGISDNWLRLITWIVCDGTLVDNSKYVKGSIKRRIQFKLSYTEKIKCLENLLKEMKIKYTIRKATKSGENKLQPYLIRIYGDEARYIHDDLFNGVKEFPEWFRNLSREQLMVVVKTLLRTDASRKSSIIVDWITINKRNVDIIQECCIKNGMGCTWRYKDNSQGYNKKGTKYVVYIRPEITWNDKQLKIETIDYNDYVYCFTMPKGTLVTRFNGKVAFTGNCHIGDWVNNRPIKSQEFEQKTKVQFYKANAEEMRKKCKGIYRKLRQCFIYKYENKVVLCTHGGLSKLPANLSLINAEQMIKGVGYYKDMLEVNQSFAEFVGDREIYQVHGHRNVEQVGIKVNDRCFNLNGNIEFGGNLRTLTLDENGFKWYRTPNPVYAKPEGENFVKVEDMVDVMKNNEYIKVKEQEGTDIISLNFTRDAFKGAVWNGITTKARGLFVNTKTNKVVARAYDKFFHLNERAETNLDVIPNRFIYPVTAFKKENGFLGILGYDDSTDEILYCSKSEVTGEYSQYFKDLLLSFVTEKDLRKVLVGKNISLLFEVVDIKNDPHIIKYKDSVVVLLDIVENSINYIPKSYEEVCEVAKVLNIPYKQKHKVFSDKEELLSFFKEIMRDDYKCDGKYIEGFVFSDIQNNMVKFKTEYYKYWKMIRGQVEQMSKGNKPKVQNKFLSWVAEDKNRTKLDIITLRDMYIKQNKK